MTKIQQAIDALRTLGVTKLADELQAEVDSVEPFGWIVESEGNDDSIMHPFFKTISYEYFKDFNSAKILGNELTENGWLDVVIKELYTSTPARKPLSDLAINTELNLRGGGIYKLSFKAGVRFAEKHHNIGADNERKITMEDLDNVSNEQ